MNPLFAASRAVLLRLSRAGRIGGLAVARDASFDRAWYNLGLLFARTERLPEAIAALFGVADPRLHAVVVGCPDGSELELVEWERPRGRAVVPRVAQDDGILSGNLRVTGIEALVGRLADGGLVRASQSCLDG